ncbi:MAG TPA: lysophospholipid acyltransferase family protein [Thermoanaerobaculia bacterium]|jgi:1-acyl-sn-glycerol-3-phosphate acyltransferase|nr:lysophospholipid acyltransferase family protein [Thermoanaerobaculia bacterium]
MTEFRAPVPTDPLPRFGFGAWLMTVTGNAWLLIGSILLGFLSVPASWIPPRGSWGFVLMRFWARGLLKASGVEVTAELSRGIDPRGNYVLLANHQSMFDIPVLLSTVPGQVRMMAKRSLFRLPFFGWGLSAAGFVPVDRDDGSKARQAFAAASAHLSVGTSILLFPEGTRSRTGEMRDLQRGGFLLAIRHGLRIVPVGIRGTRQIQPRGRWEIRPGPVEIRFGEPIDPAAYGVRRMNTLIAEVERRIAALAGLSTPIAVSDEPTA